MRRFFCNVISVFLSFFRFAVLKLFRFKAFRFHAVERFSPNVVLELGHNSKLFLGKRVRVHSGTKIKVRSKAKMVIGDDVRINYNCIFVSRKEIQIGNGTEFGPGVLIYDHDHDYRSGLKEELFRDGEIVIGDNCWIGANTIILRNTTIGNNCVIAAGSIVKGIVPDNTVFIQKRDTSFGNNCK